MAWRNRICAYEGAQRVDIRPTESRVTALGTHSIAAPRDGRHLPVRASSWSHWVSHTSAPRCLRRLWFNTNPRQSRSITIFVQSIRDQRQKPRWCTSSRLRRAHCQQLFSTACPVRCSVWWQICRSPGVSIRQHLLLHL